MEFPLPELQFDFGCNQWGKKGKRNKMHLVVLVLLKRYEVREI